MQKQIVVDRLESCVSEIVGCLDERVVIRLDGHPCSGKTSLGELLADATGFRHFKVDSYLRRSIQGSYLDKVDVPKLTEAINSSAQGLILDCIWNRAVMPVNFRGPELHVWIEVQHLGKVWIRTFNDAAKDLETFVYETQYKPKQLADVIVTRRQPD